MDRVLVYGAGGHAKVVLDVLRQIGRYRVAGLLDDSAELTGTLRWGQQVLGGRERLKAFPSKDTTGLIVALGDNRQRQSVFEEAVKEGWQMVTVIHPSVQVGGGVQMGAGSLLVAGVVINADTMIGANVILNTGATVDHDCRIGDHVHVSPGVHLAGNVTVGELAHIGIGAVVVPQVVIGRGSMVGAGAVVLADVPDGAVVAGNPARPIHGG